MAAFVEIAFSNACRVRMRESTRSSRTISTMRRRVRCARVLRRAPTAGIAALPGRLRPRASTMQAIVEAVPMVMQWPLERFMHASASTKSQTGIVPAHLFGRGAEINYRDPKLRAKNLPISFAQRRARQHNSFAPGNSPQEFLMEGSEPRQAIRVGQRNAKMHFFAVGCGMEVVRVQKSPGEFFRQHIAHSCSSRAGDAQDQKHHAALWH